MAFQISHGLTDCLYGFLCSRVNVAVEKICREAISNVLVSHMAYDGDRTATCASTFQFDGESVAKNEFGHSEN